MAIVDNLESRNLKGVVTQSQLVHFIWENMKLLGQTKYGTSLFLPHPRFIPFRLLCSHDLHSCSLSYILNCRLDKQVKDFKEVFHEVFTINRKATTLDAFQLISEKVSPCSCVRMPRSPRSPPFHLSVPPRPLHSCSRFHFMFLLK